MPLRLRSAGGGSVQLNPPVATSTDVVMELPAYDGAKVLTDKTPGTVLQVVQVIPSQLALTVPASGAANVNAAEMTTANTVLAFSGSITPKSTTSKILIQLKLCADASGVNVEEYVSVFRGSSLLAANLWYRRVNGHEPQTHVVNYLDSPSTSSTIQYDIRLGSGTGHTMYLNRNSSGTTSNAWNNSCSLILTEIAG